MSALIHSGHGTARRALLLLLAGLVASLTFPIAATVGQTPDSQAALEERIKALENQLKAIGSGSALPASGIVGSPADPAGTISCPDGSYVAGITAWKSSPATRFCVGCLTGIQIICKPLAGQTSGR
jgi:hypothetical protein